MQFVSLQSTWLLQFCTVRVPKCSSLRPLKLALHTAARLVPFPYSLVNLHMPSILIVYGLIIAYFTSCLQLAIRDFEIILDGAAHG